MQELDHFPRANVAVDAFLDVQWQCSSRPKKNSLNIAVIKASESQFVTYISSLGTIYSTVRIFRGITFTWTSPGGKSNMLRNVSRHKRFEC